jgi:hypothetical protein
MAKPSNPTSLAKRTYFIRFWIGMAAYVLVVLASVHALNQGVSGSWRVTIALTPLIPIAIVFASFIALMQSIDELERQIHLESLAIAAGVTAVLAITYGFLEVAHLPQPSAWYTYAVVMISWIVATPFVARKYR